MIHPKILSRKKLLSIASQLDLELAWTSEDESKHPRGERGRFAPKGKATGTVAGGGTQYKRGKQRFSIPEGQSQAEAYQSAVAALKAKRAKKQARRVESRVKFNEGVKSWRDQLREEQNIDIASQAREGELQHTDTAKDIINTTAKEAGILWGLNAARNSAKKLFGKAASKKGSKITKVEQPILAEVVQERTPAEVKKAAKATAAKAAKPWMNVAKGAKTVERQAAFRAYGQQQASKAYQEAIKNVGTTAATGLAINAGTNAAVSAGTKLVGAGRWAKLAAPFASVGGAAMRVGGALLHPAIGIPLVIAGAGAYFHHRNKKRNALIEHERELMRRESSGDPDREYYQNIRTKTARDVHREAIAYATKKYAQQQVDVQKEAIDEVLNHSSTKRGMKRSARITAYAAAKEYAKHERQQAYRTRENNHMLYW